MVNPCPSSGGVDTAYGVKGNSWGCGWHDGVDYAAYTGDDILSAWGGTVVEAAYPTSFGSAFGRAVVIDHDKLPDGSPGLWGLYAHMSSDAVSPGQRVEAGQKIGEIGATGNVTGPHLHFGIYGQAAWCSGCGQNPQRWIDAGGSVPAPPSGWMFPAGHEVHAKYLKWHGHELNSDGFSNSIKAWQEMLNHISISGGQELPITGQWFDMTAQETQLHQRQFIPPEDSPLSAVFVGSQQFEKARQQSGSPYVWVG
jgi:Peptidase family M23